MSNLWGKKMSPRRNKHKTRYAPFFIGLALLSGTVNTVSAEPSDGKLLIRNVVAKAQAAGRYEVEVDRVETRLAKKAPLSELRAIPMSEVMVRGERKRAFRYHVERTEQGRIKNWSLRKGQEEDRQAASPTEPGAEGLEGGPEALFTMDPQDLFAGIDQAVVTELFSDQDRVVLKIEMPPGAAPAPDWPEMWLRATFDRERDVLLKSELVVKGEPRIIGDFSYRRVDARHWLPSGKEIRIIEEDGVIVIEDIFGQYRKAAPARK